MNQRDSEKHKDAAGTGDDPASAEQLSQFYKQFLDSNYQLHKNYNRFVTSADNDNICGIGNGIEQKALNITSLIGGIAARKRHRNHIYIASKSTMYKSFLMSSV